jgi:hypothetical protein
MDRQMITVYVGDVAEYLSTVALKQDPTATLLTIDHIANLSSGTYYTSIGDLEGIKNFSTVLKKADKIIYVPPVEWSDSFLGKSLMKRWTEDCLTAFAHYGKLVENLPAQDVENKSTMLELSDFRKTSQSQLWISGCSISHGVGVDHNQRYGQILSDRLSLPVSFLTNGGTSVIWAADQILRSDIRKNDILVWGLTSIPRLPVFADDKLHHVYPHSTVFQDLLVKSQEDILYRSLISIYQVINFCKKIEIDLFLINVFDNVLVNYLDDVEVISLHNLWGKAPYDQFEDLGTDHSHPGVKTHMFYAEEIFKRMKERIS